MKSTDTFIIIRNFRQNKRSGKKPKQTIKNTSREPSI